MGSLTVKRRTIAKEISNKLANKFKRGLLEIWLYGSVARGDDKKFSDIDIRCLTKPYSFLAKGYKHPKVREEAHNLKSEMKKKGQEVIIEFQRFDEFYELLKYSQKLKNPSYKDRWSINIIGEGILLYNSKEKIA